MWDKKNTKDKHMLEAQLGYRVEAHKCGLGTLARGTLVTIESDPKTNRS